MDAFYASVEQASKPSLRGKAVIVGGLGPRGVVATASYEARRFGVHSAMPMAQARRLCPNGACLIPRFSLYRAVSDVVMALLRELSPLVEPLSLDEAFVDLEAGGTAFDAESALETGQRLRADILAATGLNASVGLAGSKMLAKVASEEAKPDGLLLIEPGTERALLAPMSVRTLPGVGPATGETACGGPGSPPWGSWPRPARTNWSGWSGARTGSGCTGWRWGWTTGRWSPSATRSPCRSRTPSTWTCTTGCGSGTRCSGSPTGVCTGCGTRGTPGARSC